MTLVAGDQPNTGSPSGDRNQDQLATRESQAGPSGVAERPVLPGKPRNAGGGKGLQLEGNSRSDEDGGIAGLHVESRSSCELRRRHSPASCDWRSNGRIGLVVARQN
jgi:hypothetical protein